jgi:uncharacterized OB-fold protein
VSMTERSLPNLALERDASSTAFYDGATAGYLVIQRCLDCRTFAAPDATSCPRCGRTVFSTERACGDGQLISWTSVHRAPHPGFAELVPYVVGIVELAEGPWLYARLMMTAEQAHSGAPVRVEFVASIDGESYPVFVPRLDQ